MKLPFEIYRVFNEVGGFDALVDSLLRSEGSEKKAYYKALDMVHKYSERFEPYKSYEAYRQRKYYQMKMDRNIPNEILEAASSIEGFDDMFDRYYPKYDNANYTYLAVIRDIRRYFKDYSLYVDARSYLSNRNKRIRKKLRK